MSERFSSAGKGIFSARKSRQEASMSFPIFIHQNNGHFVATLVGVPEVRVTAPTRDAVLAEMQAALQQRISCGEIVFLDLSPKKGIMALAGKYRDDESLTEICEEAYRQRDAEPKE
jgi:hypothetical protein